MPFFFNRNRNYQSYPYQPYGYGWQGQGMGNPFGPHNGGMQRNNSPFGYGSRPNQPGGLPWGQPSPMAGPTQNPGPLQGPLQQGRAPRLPFHSPQQQGRAPHLPFQNPQQQGEASGQRPPGPLPDGVRYEPLDEKTMELIKNLQQKNPSPPSSSTPLSLPGPGNLPALPPLPAETPKPPELPPTENFLGGGLRKLEEFIQNERNAQEYYQYLSDIAPKRDYRRALAEISEECGHRHTAYHNIYQQHKGSAFQPREEEIHRGIGFREGVAWAISVESRGLRELSRLMSQVGDDKTYRAINAIAYSKISDLNMLQAISGNAHFS